MFDFMKRKKIMPSGVRTGKVNITPGMKSPKNPGNAKLVQLPEMVGKKYSTELTRKKKMSPEEAMTKGIERGLKNFRVR